MADSPRHRFIVPPGSDSTALPVHTGWSVCHVGFPGRVWFTLEDGALHSVRGESVRTPSPERPELRAVADISERPSVGQRLSPYAFLALLSARRLSDLWGRSKLESVDDSRPLRSVK